MKLNMALYVVGLDAKTHSVEEREKYALLEPQFIHQNKKLIETSLVNEIVTLSTCNRIEHYFVTDNHIDSIIPALFKGSYPKNLYIHKGSHASHHLFQVSSGLESNILGENEILGQIKKAYLLAQENNLTGRILNIIFQKAIYVGKRVRTITDISKCSVSTGGIILDKIKKRFKNLDEIKVLLIGAGEITRVISTTLHQKNIKNLYVMNRGHAKGEHLAQEMEANFIPMNKLYDSMKDMDVIISSTSAPHYIISNDHTSYLGNNYKLIIDLAVPRDVHPDLGSLDFIELINIDSISTLSQLNQNKRKLEIQKALQIISIENCSVCNFHSLSESDSCNTIHFFDFKQLYRNHKKSPIL